MKRGCIVVGIIVCVVVCLAVFIFVRSKGG